MTQTLGKLILCFVFFIIVVDLTVIFRVLKSISLSIPGSEYLVEPLFHCIRSSIQDLRVKATLQHAQFFHKGHLHGYTSYCPQPCMNNHPPPLPAYNCADNITENLCIVKLWIYFCDGLTSEFKITLQYCK